MSDEDQYWSMRATAYVGVLQAGVEFAAAMRAPQATMSMLSLEQAVEAARLFASEPLEQALLALVSDARRWARVAAANARDSTADTEAGALVDQHLSRIRVLMRDDARPAPTVRYADDSTVLARLRIGYAREKPRSQQEKALTAGWPQILNAAVIDLVTSVLWWAVWFKAAVWLIGTYWWTDLPSIGWLPAISLAFVIKLLLLKSKVSEPFPLPAQNQPAPDHPERR